MEYAKEASGKLNSAHMIAGIGAVSPSNRLIITDRHTGYRFLIDTGANISVIPCIRKWFQQQAEIKLYAANGTVINTYGEKTLTMDLGLRRPFRWTFVIADVLTPILGADFLEHYKLLVDIYGRRLVDGHTRLSTLTGVSRSRESSVRTIEMNHELKELLEKYEAITRSRHLLLPVKHGVRHHIETRGQPVHCKARPLPLEKYRIAKKEFQDMVNEGICRPSNSPWASPLHMVKKKNGEWRPCGDYRRLNNVTVPDRYPVPRLEDVAYLLEGKKVFSKIDIRKAYHNIPVNEEDIQKTAIITPFGLFEFPKMPFGLRNAGQTFQRFMDSTVLQGLSFIYCFVDDCILAADSEEEAREQLEEVFKRLNL